MKIALIGPAFPLRGGIANFNEALARSLSKEGHEVIIWSFSLQYPSILFPGKSQFDKGVGPVDLNIKTKINSINPVSWFKTASQISSWKPDLVLVRFWLPFMGPSLGTICRRVRSKTKAPVIAIVDNMIPHEKRPGDKMLSKYFTSSCDGFIAMSRAVLNDISTFSSSPFKAFLPHPVYDIFGDKIDKATAKSALGLSEKKRVILFFGFIRKYKGLDLLLKAMCEKRVRDLGITLVVAGEFYDDEKYYTDIIAQENISSNVILKKEFIPSEEVKNYFCASDLVVQPYRTATQSGVSQIAYHFEKPMVVTDVGGLGEMVDHMKGGYVVLPEPVEIAKAIEDFFLNGREDAFSSYLTIAKERFSWTHFVKGIESLSTQIKASVKKV